MQSMGIVDETELELKKGGAKRDQKGRKLK